MGVTVVQTFAKVTYTKNGQCLLYGHCDLCLKNSTSPFGVIQVADTGTPASIMSCQCPDTGIQKNLQAN